LNKIRFHREFTKIKRISSPLAIFYFITLWIVFTFHSQCWSARIATSDEEKLQEGKPHVVQPSKTPDATSPKALPLELPERKGRPSGSLITMNFDNADIRTVIKFISEITEKNFIVDDNVKGTVTVISPGKITIDEAYRVFESILEVKGFTAVPAGKVIKIVPSSEAKAKDILTNIGKTPLPEKTEDRVITQIVPLEYANAQELKGILQPLMSKGSNIVAYTDRNTLIITDYASNIDKLMRIIKEIDVAGPREEISVIKLNYASARTMASQLTSLLETRRRTVQRRVVTTPAPTPAPRAEGIGEGLPSISKVFADERTNSLVILASPDETKSLISLVEKLDQPIPKGQGRINVYYLENANAEELVKVLTQLPSKIKGAKEQTKGEPGQPTAPILGEDVSIMADKPTNSLIITASPQDYDVIKEVIQKLDIARSQVLVEALIAEVSFEKTKELGIEWYGVGRSGETAIIGGSATSGRPSGIRSPEQMSALSAEGLILGAFSGPITYAGREFFRLSALIKALQTSSDVNIISTPTLLTMDNEEAEIVIGEERPFLKSDITSLTTGETTTRTFEYKDVATTLRITPQISKGKFVRLKIFQEVKSFKGQATLQEPTAVITTKRQAKTTVIVENGQMIVIGGLLQDKKDTGDTAVPCLGNIPVLGWLFKYFRESKAKSNLLIFITPHIINTPEDLSRVTQQIREEAEKAKVEFQKEKKENLRKNIELLWE
jgi:general secretion pathway protein D